MVWIAEQNWRFALDVGYRRCTDQPARGAAIRIKAEILPMSGTFQVIL